ncbi:hypothetical protein C8F00_2708 [Xanthomonas vasicola]
MDSNAVDAPGSRQALRSQRHPFAAFSQPSRCGSPTWPDTPSRALSVALHGDSPLSAPGTDYGRLSLAWRARRVMRTGMRRNRFQRTVGLEKT